MVKKKRMGLFNWGRKAIAVDRVFRSLQIVNGQIISPADNKEAYITDGYTYNDIIYSIVNLILDKVRLPEWRQYKIVDEDSLKSYLGLMKRKDLSYEDYRKALDYKVKALQKTDGDPRIAELLQWPNDSETFGEFVANGTGYKLLTGDRYVWADTLQAGANEGKPFRLFNLPSQCILIESTNSFPAEAIRFKLTHINQSFEREQVLHDKFWNPEYDTTNSDLYGLSPLKAALRTYTRNNYAKSAMAAAFKNQGVKGILAADVDAAQVNEGNIAVLQEQSNRIKQILSSNEYTGPDAYNKFANAGYRMQWTSIGLSPVELNIIEAEKWDLKRLCAIYGVPSELVGNSEASTFSNVKEAEKALTSRCAIPQLVSFRNHLNKKMNTDWGLKDKNIFIDFDQTVFTELEENTKDKAEWVTRLWYLSPNRQLELMNLETVEDPLFDEPWVDSTRMPLSEFNPNPVDSNVDQGNDTGEPIA